MNEDIVRTGVDDLLDLLNTSTKIPLSEASAKLKIDPEVIQAWIDFLVEEGIVGIEYRFTTPYIYLNRSIETKKSEQESESNVNIEYFKKQFWDKARTNNIPESKIEALWHNHLLQELELKKKYFLFEAQRRKILKPEILWQEYKNVMMFS